LSDDLAYLGLAEAAERIRSKRLSPVEYATALLARIDRHDGKYSAFIALTPERALTAARAAEAEIMAGRWRGPFHGMPYALKDIIDVEGLATTAHSKILIGNIARRHAVVTERQAGLCSASSRPTNRHWRPFLRPALAAGPQPVEPRSFLRRLVERQRCRPRRRLLPGGARHRHRRLDPQSGLDVRHYRYEAHLWQGQPPRCRAARLLPRPYRTDDPHCGQRADAPGNRRA
jgi:hypothetical protein